MPSVRATDRPTSAPRQRTASPRPAPAARARQRSVAHAPPIAVDRAPADELGTLLARSVRDRGAGDRAAAARRTLARKFWVLDVDDTYSWREGDDTTGLVAAGVPNYKQPGSWFAWPVYRTEAGAAFAGLLDRWARPRVVALAALFAQDGGTIAARNWVLIAGAGAGLVDREADVASFARIRHWRAADRLALAGLYAHAVDPRPAADWSAIATSHGELTNEADDVASFAAIKGGWSQAGLVELAKGFGVGSGERPAAEWASLAPAHALLADRHDAVASVAREGWTRDNLAAVVTAAHAAGAAGPALAEMLSTQLAANRLRPMIAGRWTAANVGTFAGGLLVGGMTADQIGGFVRGTGTAALNSMRASWSPAELAELVCAATRRGGAFARLKVLMETPGFPAASHALITGPWTAALVGEFIGAAARADVQTTIATATVPASLRGLTGAGWSHVDVGTFVAAARIDGVADDALAALLAQPQFIAASQLMRDAGWNAQQRGSFVAGALTSGLSDALLVAMMETAGFAAASHSWLAPGWSAKEVGTIAGKARQEGFAALDLVAFMNTANAAQSAFALRARWHADEVGKTIGYCRTRPGAPDDPQMERLLFLARTPINGSQIRPEPVRNAALADTCGAPAWDAVILRIPDFQRCYRGTRANTDASAVKWSLQSAGVNKVRLQVYGNSIDHVEAGHTFEHFEFSYGNCTRAGVGVAGNCSFFAAGLSVRDKLLAVRDDPAARTLAENAAKNAVPGAGGGLPTQGTAQACTVGLASGAPTAGGDPVSQARISQCYPNAGTQIVGRDLVAMGRYFGFIP